MPATIYPFNPYRPKAHKTASPQTTARKPSALPAETLAKLEWLALAHPGMLAVFTDVMDRLKERTDRDAR
jgi:hypothetical protein